MNDTEVKIPRRGPAVRLSEPAKRMLEELSDGEQRQQSKELAVIIERYYKTWKEQDKA
jgi:hypothetical protein